MDRDALADFLLRRREALKPADVGLTAGPRRRAPGLRREEVAHLTGMSVDYYARLEQARSPQPSTQMLRALARTLRLSRDESDHLHRLAGHPAPDRVGSSSHVRPVLLHVLDQLDDCAAFVCSDTDEVLAQNRLSVLLQGDHSGASGLSASSSYRWFTQPGAQDHVVAEDRHEHSRARVADLRATWARRHQDDDIRRLVDALLAESPEFAEIWERHEVGVKHLEHKRFVHPQVGQLTVDCETLATDADGQRLIILGAAPGTEAHGKLQLLRVLGEQSLDEQSLDA
ncbi:helix-turn-helix transcriptional regulator [Aeromicrobium fastidiosum]|uniref:Helix-turn-helix domain-containing protein n=1 Tax=Aeromicrobium fastidiosum TaxID=52699 RepID=A0A641ARZ2_9ACTN|nr:helix-turn-helix transcriptional regulator [Aeromicrobium fastidiosum]KAA1379983.1 helix-turn-helix domain-containing protein [Aeromicrobium fastidiosum]MBP2389502.1 transcriptional regulator with XRE-family HTH domain [Aeromicrobium fastidiosum]